MTSVLGTDEEQRNACMKFAQDLRNFQLLRGKPDKNHMEQAMFDKHQFQKMSVQQLVAAFESADRGTPAWLADLREVVRQRARVACAT
eukprot:659250-Pyramimonas_sp.AAC.1